MGNKYCFPILQLILDCELFFGHSCTWTLCMLVETQMIVRVKAAADATVTVLHPTCDLVQKAGHPCVYMVISVPLVVVYLLI